MPSIRNLKKYVNYQLSDVIEYTYVWQLLNPDKSAKGDEVIDKAIEKFDDLISKINLKNIDNKKEHFRNIQQDLKQTIAVLEKELKN